MFSEYSESTLMANIVISWYYNHNPHSGSSVQLSNIPIGNGNRNGNLVHIDIKDV